jgi:hypothetical protein
MNNNKLIAEFMGMDSFKDSLASLHQGKINVDVDVYEQAQYHTSWDWLMPVILKIGREYKLGNLVGVMRALRKHSTLRGFDEIYEAAVGFIKEHNNQDTEEEACDMLYGVDNNQ